MTDEVEEREARVLAPRASALARELDLLSPRQRSMLGIRDWMLPVLDGVVGVVHLIGDESDTRPWTEKLEEAFAFAETLQGELHDDAEADIHQIFAMLERLQNGDLPPLVAAIGRRGPRKFMHRLVGEAAYVRIIAALKADAAVVALGVTRLSRLLQPYSIAVDDLASRLSESRRRSKAPYDAGDSTMFEIAIQFDAMLQKLIESQLSDVPIAAAFLDSDEALDHDDIEDLTARFRDVVAGRSRSVVDDLGGVFSRKVRGAQDALQYSSDPVSQAANSLLEFVDRLLRQSFPDDVVLAWIDASDYEDKTELVFERPGSGAVVPTKKAVALCFTHAGMPMGEQTSSIHEIAAEALIAARNELQGLKHADESGDLAELAERERIAMVITAIDSFMALTVGLLWVVVPDEALNEVRARLDPPDASEQSA